MNRTDPATICESDKDKLIALYERRVSPSDVIAKDDPRRDSIAAEMLDVGIAPDADAAFEVIRWWDPIEANIKHHIKDIRRSFCRLKLVGTYTAGV